MATKRKDKNRIILKSGESQKKDGRYMYRWTASDGKRRTLYAKTLDELRAKEKEIDDLNFSGALYDSRNATLNDAYEIWVKSKSGLKDSSLSQYQCNYDAHVRNIIGNTPMSKFTLPSLICFYNDLSNKYHLSKSTIEILRTIVDQIFDIMVDANIIEKNINKAALKRVCVPAGKSAPKIPLTQDETNELLNYVKSNGRYRYRYPLLIILLGTGMRVGEAAALCWSDIDFANNAIYISKTAYTYMDHGKSVTHITPPKSECGVRVIPMLDCVRSAFMDLKKKNIHQDFELDGYKDFVFGRKNNILSTNSLRIGLRNIENSYNALQEDLNTGLSLPRLYPHIFRHTFATRLCEQGVNPKIIQVIMGHSDISTTYNIYVKPTQQMYQSEYEKIADCFPAYNNAISLHQSVHQNKQELCRLM